MGCIRNTFMIRISLILLNRIRNLIRVQDSVVIVCPVQVIWFAIGTFTASTTQQATY